ncbi:hypothetical protein [Sinomonas sp. ASV322]|uniref:hypothetical protein n=1 Tax=Sinomonas sp. ASV322 TaxID=3041920 RepID=UPI0027DCF3AD|nr:hypothetical protein [Sinomonas sp. ASV322]MDQ4502985.1 hypothetical protein [Sinomonas sp. ASV322]
MKKLLAALSLALLTLVAVPTVATAAGYVPSGNVSVSGTPTPGGTTAVGFSAGSFTSGETVTYSVSGNTTATLSAVKAAILTTFSKPAAADGSASVNVALPSNASGTYTLTATGQTSGNVGTASLTVVPQNAQGNQNQNGQGSASLANTGATMPILLVWIGAGALLLGAAIVGTLMFVRRQKRNA